MQLVRPILFAFGTLLLLNTCRPKDVISATQMEDVLCDLHRADGILYVKGFAYGRDEAASKYYEVVLQKHGITQAVFDSSLVWYTDHPQRFNKIYPKVVARLEAEKERLIAQSAALDDTLQADTLLYTPQSIPSLDDWLKIMQEGLPLQWKIKSSEIDTAFIYPYLATLQDSLHVSAQALLQDTVTTSTSTTERVDSPSCPQDTIRSILHPDAHRIIDSDPNGQGDKKKKQSNRLSLERVKPSLKQNHNIPARE